MGEEITLDSFATEEETRVHHYHHSHSIFSPSLAVQKLTQAKDYVESLHQNERAPLLYGKNNVIVQPVSDAESFLLLLSYSDFHDFSKAGSVLRHFMDCWLELSLLCS